MTIFATRILINRRVVQQSFKQTKEFRNFNYSHRFLQSMCQGHDEAPAVEAANVPAAGSSGQPAQTEQKKKQKFPKNKQKQQNGRQTPPVANPLPTHEIVKSIATKLANGTRYVDTHCHAHMTVQMYQAKAKSTDPVIVDIPGFFKEFFPPECASIVDIYCDPPFDGWKDMADQTDLPLDYHFAIGCHPHNAKRYDDEIEGVILEAMKHPKCVAWGEMGLDYHYNLSPQDIQQNVLIRQLKLAISHTKPLVIHTREADDDILRILTTHVPRETHLHIHCFTDTPDLAASLLSHFPNLFIGITGVITYASNINTTEVVKATPLERLLLETDSPFMTPNNVQKAIKAEGGKSTRLPICWSGMIPWTAEWVANIKGETVGRVLEVTRQNAERMYGITV